MTHTTSIGSAPLSSANLGAAERTSTRTAPAAAKNEVAVTKDPGTTKLSGLGSILALSGPGTDDVRTDKVAALKSAIESGTYNVPASAVADKLISGLLG